MEWENWWFKASNLQVEEKIGYFKTTKKKNAYYVSLPEWLLRWSGAEAFSAPESEIIRLGKKVSEPRIKNLLKKTVLDKQQFNKGAAN